MAASDGSRVLRARRRKGEGHARQRPRACHQPLWFSATLLVLRAAAARTCGVSRRTRPSYRHSWILEFVHSGYFEIAIFKHSAFLDDLLSIVVILRSP